MSQSIAVDCLIDKDGRVRVRGVQFDGQWLAVEQGRQWMDEEGRHVLIIVPGREVEEILLSSRSLQWQIVPRRAGPHIA